MPISLSDVGPLLGLRQGSTGRLVVSLPYSASITPSDDAGPQAIVATDGNAFTINGPVNSVGGDELHLDIKNSSGGVMGAVTFAAAYLPAGAFTVPANGTRRTISFYFDGTNWVELNRAAADI